jgi:regulator of RNase E activity RraB
MGNKPDMAERVGSAINELDIDFSRFTLVGWIVTLLSLGSGGGAAYVASRAMIGRKGFDLAAGMTFFLTMVAVTTCVFWVLRWLSGLAGLPVSKSELVASNNANRDTLNRMADVGMNMNVAHAIDFWLHFEKREDAEQMTSAARQKEFNVVSIEANDEAGGFDVQVQVELIPTLETIGETEKKLATIAERCRGRADGWGVRQ